MVFPPPFQFAALNLLKLGNISNKTSSLKSCETQKRLPIGEVDIDFVIYIYWSFPTHSSVLIEEMLLFWL